MDDRQKQRDEEIDEFLRTTHRAWRTVEIPNVPFPEDRVLPLKTFGVKWRQSDTTNQGLISIWNLLSPIPVDEFLISWFYHRGNFGIGRQLWFFLSNKRLLLWDTKLKRHHILSLDKLSGFSQLKGKFVAHTNGGQDIEITISSLTFIPSKSTVDMINSVCKWASTGSKDQERVVPTGMAQQEQGKMASPSGPAYSPESASIPLRWYYANRGAAWATSLPVIIWLIAIFNAGSGSIILPGFLGILLLGAIGYGGGYIYGYLNESGTKAPPASGTGVSQKPAEPTPEGPDGR